MPQIGGGKILSDGSLAELRARVTRERWLTVDLDDGAAWTDEPDAPVIRRDGNRVCLAFDPQRIPPAELIRRVVGIWALFDRFGHVRGWTLPEVALFYGMIPLGCVTYLPGLAILGRPDPLGTPVLAQWLAPLAGPAFLALSLAVWRLGVRHYRSTGS